MACLYEPMALIPLETILILLLAARSDSSLPDDQVVSSGVRDGDHQAFKCFFERYHTYLYRYLTRMGVVPNAAEDLVQQAFLTIWERRSQIDPTRSLRAYLFQIGHNRALNYFRERRRIEDENEFPDPEDPTPGGDQMTDASLLKKRLEEAITQLPGRRRAVFELCFLQDFTYREAAEVLGISPKTVENQMSQALKFLRASLTDFR